MVDLAGRSLRRSKRRERKPFALMAADVEIIRRYCTVDSDEERLLGRATAPIVLVNAEGPKRLPEEIAPGLGASGFMLRTPLHALMLRRLDRPVVMTSCNVPEELQATDNDEARIRLARIAPYALIHEREIANRVEEAALGSCCRGRQKSNLT